MASRARDTTHDEWDLSVQGALECEAVVVRWELWQDDEGTTHSFFPITNTQAATMAEEEDLHLAWTLDAVSWNEAMAKYHDHQGWEPYRPMLRSDGTPHPEDDAPFAG